MKRLALALIIPLIGIQPVLAKGNINDYTDESNLVEHRHYTSSDGHRVHSPAHTKNGIQPAGASAICRDGTYSFSRHRRGTCSHGHHGVKTWLKRI